jgi:Response regulator containing CheY-like receiver, AAA-type ATPase, and DNA-binding domains
MTATPWLDARILVVDDIEANVLLLTNLLRQQGFRHVDSTIDAREVAGLHQAKPYDLILLDLQMPHLDGFAVMDQLKPVAGADFLPVIVVTAFSDQENRLRALRRGARDYVLKPFVADEVLQRIRNYLEVRFLYRERQRSADARAPRARASGAARKPVAAETLFLAAARRAHPRGRRRRSAAHPPPRNLRRLHRPARLHRFTEIAEPEEVMGVLREYHQVTGRMVVEYEGTLEHFTGDGITILFNDPVPIPNPAERAVGWRWPCASASAAWRRTGRSAAMT